MILRTSISLVLLTPALAFAERPSFAEGLARALLLPAQLGFERAYEKDLIPSAFNQCVQSLKPSSLQPDVEAALQRKFSADEIGALNAFSASPAGIKYYARGLSMILVANGKTPPPASPLTPEESRDFAAFAETSAGTKFLKDKALESPEVAQALRARVGELLKRCELQ